MLKLRSPVSMTTITQLVASVLLHTLSVIRTHCLTQMLPTPHPPPADVFPQCTCRCVLPAMLLDVCECEMTPPVGWLCKFFCLAFHRMSLTEDAGVKAQNNIFISKPVCHEF